jgi:hypothetical protein
MFNLLQARQKKIVALGGVLVLMVIVSLWTFFSAGNISAPPSPEPTFVLGQEVTLEGTSVCLPHKDTSGPITLECAFGLKTDDNLHYALDTTLYFPEEIASLPSEQRIAVTGIYTPTAMVEDKQLTKYAIQGLLRITAVELR